jgi:phosphatidylserine synthase
MYDTFLFQVRAAIPMSHFTGMYAIPAFLGEQFSRLFPLTLACCMAFTGFLMYDRKHVYKSMDSRKRYTLLFIGLTLLILPACFLMVSVKYQDELGYGKGYLPVYIQDFHLYSPGRAASL